MCLRNIVEHQRKQLPANEVTGEPLNSKDLLVQIMGYLIPMVALSLLAFMGKEPLVDYPPEGGDSAIFFLILTQCFLMSHLTISLMVCHVTRSHFSPFKSRIMIM